MRAAAFDRFEREFLARRKIYRVSPTKVVAESWLIFFAVLLITNHFIFFGSIGLTQRHFSSILAE